MIWHVFTDHNAEKEDIWAFLGVLGEQIGQKGGHVLQEEDVW